MILEKMNEFFDKRADTYDGHMLEELQLTKFYEAIADCFEICDCFEFANCFNKIPKARSF
jgi:hypothetical protein